MRRRTPILSAVVLLLVLALALPGLARAGGKKPIERPIGSVVITGELEERVFLTFEQFEALPLTSHNVSVMFQAGPAVEQHTFTGFLLFDVLNLLKPQFDPDVKNDKLRFYVSATATDDYQAIVAWGELDPGFENKPILLAVTQDGQSLASQGLRLVVPPPAEVLNRSRRTGEA
jgi:hypothetical protein